MSRQFLVSYFGLRNDGSTFVGSCTSTISDGEKMTQNRLNRVIEGAAPNGAAKVTPIAVSELEVDDEEEQQGT